MNRLVAIIGVVILAGCAGPTKSGKEARIKAHNRMDVVNANLAAQQAMQQFEVGQLKAAIETIDAAINRFETNAEYHLLRGRILLEQHRLDAANKALSRSIELDPTNAEPHYFIGILYQRWSDDASALASYKKAMECNDTHPQFLLATAESYVALGQMEEALALLDNSGKEFQHQPSVMALIGHIHLRNGNPKEASKFLSNSRLLGNDDTEVLTLLATAQYSAGEYAQCLSTLVQLEQFFELSCTFQRLRGKCLAATGRQIQGRDICLKVTKQTPDDAGAWVDLGYIAWDMGDYDRVALCGKRISQLSTELIEGPLFEGIVALRLGDTVRAREFLSQAQSDNTIAQLDSLFEIYAKTAKFRVETPITPNMTANSVEGKVEQQPLGQVERSQSIVEVTQDSTLAP
jgi:tetratricopeptide (TPR) repeat protein